MGYRNTQKKRPVMCDVTSFSEIHILNGVVAEFAIPCFYDLSIGTTNRNCGKRKPPELEPIDLLAEGYVNFELAFDVLPPGLTYQVWRDEEESHIIRMWISAQCPGALTEPIECQVSLLITRFLDAGGRRTDSVFRGTLTIEPSPLPAS